MGTAHLVSKGNRLLFLTKLLPVFVYPLGSSLLILAFGLVCAAMAWRRLSVACFGVAILWLWTASTPVFANWALGTLERQYPPLPLEAIPSSDVAIVIGGALRQAAPPRQAPDLGEASDRVLHAARLYRAGKVKRILVSGGQVPWQSSGAPEAELISALLVEWGVPRNSIEVTTTSRNTYENAREISQIRQRMPFGSALLVTSAAHMPRALAVFEKAGLPVTAASTDVHALEADQRTILDWLPQADALKGTTNAIKEWIGLIVYRGLGYV